MDTQTYQEIQDVYRMTVRELRDKYLDVFGEETHAYNKDFLRKRIAWRIQAMAEGDLTERARRRAAQLANDSDLRVRAPRDPVVSGSAEVRARSVVGHITSYRDPRLPLPGTLLVREYKGRDIIVKVLDQGFGAEGGKLIVNDAEAVQARTIYQLYLEYKAMMPVVQEIERRGWRTKQWRTRKGQERGGDIITKNSLFRLLTNVLCAGKVDHKGTIYDGEHPAIVETDLWQEVQDTLRRNGRNGGKDVRNKYGALLKGLLYCALCGTAMIHTYTAKSSGKRCRYYVCLSAQQRGWASCPTKSLNAHEIESAVVEQIRGLGENPEIVAATLEQAQRESVARLSELETEQRVHLRKLAQLNARVKKLVDDSTREITGNAATDQLADLQEQIRAMEQRMVVVRQDIVNLHSVKPSMKTI